MDKIKTFFVYDKKNVYKLIIIIIIIMLSLVLYYRGQKSDTITLENDNNSECAKEKKEEKQKENKTMFVDISGEVNAPGVYEISKDTRIFELIELAGGLKEGADLNAVNQADFVHDGDKIIISSVAVSESTGSDQSSGLISINNADKTKLMELPGVGEVTAGLIIDYRTKQRFTDKKDLMNIKGIGEVTYSKIEPEITL